MRDYLWKKLKGMIPTLLGIALVTFAMVHLAPGDPVTMQLGGETRAGAISAEVGQDLRRTYFLHLPLFINTDLEEGGAAVRDLLRRLNDEATRPAAAREIALRGCALFPYLLPRLGEVKGGAREALVGALDAVGERMGLKEEIEAATDRGKFWQRFWQTYRLDFTEARAARLVRRLSQKPDPLVEEELRRLDTFALPQILTELAARPGSAAEGRLVALASRVTGREGTLDPQAAVEARERAIHGWGDWWRQRYADYVFPQGIERFADVVTETQFYKWVSRIVTLDFGMSITDHRPIADKLKEKLPVTLLLSLLSVFVAYGIAIPLGVFSAVRRGTRSDRILTVGLFVLYSLPSFWVAMMCIQLFGGVGGLDLFPIRGIASEGSASWPLWRRVLDLGWHLVLPVTCLSYVSLAVLSRYQRSSMLEVIRQGYITTARAKGLKERSVIVRHALRNALIPVVTLLGLQLPFLIGGSVIIESIFNIPGMGLETFDAIRGRDYNWIMAVTTITAILTMVGIMATDLLYALIDPRLEPGGGPEREVV